MDLLDRYRHPWLFYGLCFIVPGTFALIASGIGYQPPAEVFGVVYVLSPMLIAFCLIGADRKLSADCFRRLTTLTGIRRADWLLALGIMPISILLAIAASLPFGYGMSQFRIATQPSFSAGILSVWAILIVVPIIEELAWHTYGTDCLRRRLSLFHTCLVFSVFWVLWHAPAVFVQGYYQNNLVRTGVWETVNFAVSIFPVVILMNWLYLRTGRSVWIAILFHVTTGFSNEIFSPHPRTKLFQTGILLMFAAVLVVHERELFFRRAPDPSPRPSAPRLRSS